MDIPWVILVKSSWVTLWKGSFMLKDLLKAPDAILAVFIFNEGDHVSVGHDFLAFVLAY